MKRHYFYAVISVACVGLAACGGGGSDSSSTTPTAFDNTEFQGTWVGAISAANAGGFDACILDLSYDKTGYYVTPPTSVISKNAITYSQLYYTDAQCTAKAGKLSIDLTATWTAGTVTGYDNVARVEVAFVGYTLSKDGTGSGITLSSPPSAASENGKTILDVRNTNQLWFGVSKTGAPRDADGYPSTFRSQYTYTR